MTHDETLYLETLAEFASTLVASYDVASVLADLTNRLTDVLDSSAAASPWRRTAGSST